MKRQKEMEESFLIAHRDFMKNLEKSFEIIEHDLKEAESFDECRGEWCEAIECNLDEMAKYIFSISEPRWLPQEESNRIHAMRKKVHDLYQKYQGIRTRAVH